MRRLKTRSKELGRFLKEMREDAFVTQDAVRKLIGFKGNTSISDIETGSRKVRLDEYLMYCQACSTDPCVALLEVIKIVREFPDNKVGK